MKLHFTWLAISLSLLVSFAATAAGRERPLVGSVHQIDGHRLLVCFKKATPPDVGTALDIQRGFVPYKSSGATLYRTVGHARVTAAAQPSCVNAELLDGDANRWDRVQPGKPTVS